jgi:hypothetical protein
MTETKLERDRRIGRNWMWVAAFVLGPWLVFTWDRPAHDKIAAASAPRDADELSLRLGACDEAQEAVKARLKAPSTAVFPGCGFWGMTEYDVRSNEDRTKVSVQGYVDAQNSFGAQIRNRFIVKLTRRVGSNPYSGWIVTDVAIVP